MELPEPIQCKVDVTADGVTAAMLDRDGKRYLEEWGEAQKRGADVGEFKRVQLPAMYGGLRCSGRSTAMLRVVLDKAVNENTVQARIHVVAPKDGMARHLKIQFAEMANGEGYSPVISGTNKVVVGDVTVYFCVLGQHIEGLKVDERNVCQAFFDHTVGEDRKDVPAINLWTALFQGRPATPHVRYPQLIYPEQTPHDPDAWNTFLYGNTAP